MNVPKVTPELVTSGSQRLLNTEVFDTEYYAAESGKEFSSKTAAARHFVQHGMKAGLSFHPLFDLGMFPARFRDLYKAADVDYVLSYLRSTESREHLWSWLFDPAGLSDSVSGSLLLSKFRAGKSRVLPIPDKLPGLAPAWPKIRETLIAHARKSRLFEIGKKPLRLSSWSETAEQKWIETIRKSDLPPAGVGPVVSIVMPAWNRESVIVQAIKSVRAQSFGSWELLVVDDGSTDETRDVVRTYARLDGRIRLIEENHLGVCSARNRGIAEARGDLLAFLDSDNTWRPDFLRNMYAGLRVSGENAAYSAARMLNGREEFTGQEVTADQLLVRNYVDLNVLVMKTSLARELGGFDVSLRRWVDYDLVLRIVEKTRIAYFPFIGCDYVDDQNDERITRKESGNWEYAVLGKNLSSRFSYDGDAVSNRAPEVSIVMRITDNIDLAIRNIRRIHETVDPEAFEVLVVDEVQGFRSSQRLRAALSGVTALKYIKLPRRYTEAISYNIASAHAVGANVLFLKESVEVRAGTVEGLLRVLRDKSVAAAQPIVTDQTGVVVSAGGVGHLNSLAIPLFRGLNISDAQRHGGRSLDELTSAVFAVRAEVLKKLGFFNMIFAGEAAVVDFHRKVLASESGELVVATNFLAIDHSADAYGEYPPLAPADGGWLTRANDPIKPLVDHYKDIGLQLIGLRSPRSPRLEPAEPLIIRDSVGSDRRSALRWAIKIGADFSVGGDRWGDVPYAADLAEALVSLGQDAVVDRIGALARPSNHLDDVVLVIRGLHACDPQPGKTNVLWAISRPALITQDEVAGFDIVFGASKIWCDYVRSEWGVEAHYLPQATNPRRFSPSPLASNEKLYDLTFVGGPRKPIGRRIVADCVELGQKVSVWGPRWEQFIPSEMVVADFVDNDDLSQVYDSSKVVLNDHFEDMARWGFANNRLYDAVASGARVISDEVDGIGEIFEGAVQTYSSIDELARILSDPSGFPADSEMTHISRMVRQKHNFDKRAELLLEKVLQHRDVG